MFSYSAICVNNVYINAQVLEAEWFAAGFHDVESRIECALVNLPCGGYLYFTLLYFLLSETPF
jgi:hypothetical protein